jgi:hypothetical protein
MEATRAAFVDLLTAIPAAVWDARAIGSAWTVRQEMWHIAWGLGFLVGAIRNARKGRGIPPLPMQLVDPLNALYARLAARASTPESILKRYNANHQAALAQLDAMTDSSWHSRVRVLGKTQDLQDLMHSPAHHFEEHSARIRPLV